MAVVAGVEFVGGKALADLMALAARGDPRSKESRLRNDHRMTSSPMIEESTEGGDLGGKAIGLNVAEPVVPDGELSKWPLLGLARRCVEDARRRRWWQILRIQITELELDRNALKIKLLTKLQLLVIMQSVVFVHRASMAARELCNVLLHFRELELHKLELLLEL